MEEPRVKITSLGHGPTRPMNDDKGVVRPLVGPDDGARAIDVHLNIINADAPPFPYHLHERTENVYVVLDGTAEAIVDGVSYRLGKHEVAFIPPGVPHAAGSAGDGPVTLLEIYAPAGRDFHRLEMPDRVTPAAADPPSGGVAEPGHAGQRREGEHDGPGEDGGPGGHGG